jgi:hypothetical protein
MAMTSLQNLDGWNAISTPILVMFHVTDNSVNFFNVRVYLWTSGHAPNASFLFLTTGIIVCGHITTAEVETGAAFTKEIKKPPSSKSKKAWTCQCVEWDGWQRFSLKIGKDKGIVKLAMANGYGGRNGTTKKEYVPADHGRLLISKDNIVQLYNKSYKNILLDCTVYRRFISIFWKSEEALIKSKFAKSFRNKFKEIFGTRSPNPSKFSSLLWIISYQIQRDLVRVREGEFTKAIDKTVAVKKVIEARRLEELQRLSESESRSMTALEKVCLLHLQNLPESERLSQPSVSRKKI